MQLSSKIFTTRNILHITKDDLVFLYGWEYRKSSSRLVTTLYKHSGFHSNVQMMADFGFASYRSTLHCKNPKANHQLIITHKNYTDHAAKGIAWPSKPLLSLWLTA
jgi:hypothetical protein